MALNLADLFEHAADAFGDRLAATCDDTELTYQDLEQRVNRNTGGEKVFPEVEGALKRQAVGRTAGDYLERSGAG
jgi:hypothetical protein